MHRHTMVAATALVLALAGCGAAVTDKEPEAGAASTQALSSKRPEDDRALMLPRHSYSLERALEVDGRQGVAVEGGRMWVSGSQTLSVYDLEGNLLQTNQEPFAEGFTAEVNHIGDIDVAGGELYAGVELFVDGVASNIQIAVYDAETLTLARTFPFDPASGQDECSGICVDEEAGVVWMCSWTDTGRWLYGYDQKTGAYQGRVQLHASPRWLQGVASEGGALYLTADDGDALANEPDHLYRATIGAGGGEATVTLERTFDDVELTGEIEGLSFSDGHLYLLHNRGAIIVEGMPTGFVEGYDHEVHEVYVYEMSERAE